MSSDIIQPLIILSNVFYNKSSKVHKIEKKHKTYKHTGSFADKNA